MPYADPISSAVFDLGNVICYLRYRIIDETWAHLPAVLGGSFNLYDRSQTSAGA